MDRKRGRGEKGIDIWRAVDIESNIDFNALPPGLDGASAVKQGDSSMLYIPDAQVLLSLQPEELGGKILFILRKRNGNSNRAPQDFIFSNLMGELWPRNHLPNYQPPYPSHLRSEIDLAISEAWAWLIAQALLVPTPGRWEAPTVACSAVERSSSRMKPTLPPSLLAECSQRKRCIPGSPIRFGQPSCVESSMSLLFRQ
jgi:hypothetical protein